MLASRIVCAVAVSALLVAAATAASSAHAWERSCGSVIHRYKDRGGWEKVQASEIATANVGCRVGRGIVRAYVARSVYARTNLRGERVVRNRFPRAVGRFRCSAEYVGSDVRYVTCRDGTESVAFGWYDSSGYH